jgi:hypothetical protein
MDVVWSIQAGNAGTGVVIARSRIAGEWQVSVLSAARLALSSLAVKWFKALQAYKGLIQTSCLVSLVSKPSRGY